jgi:hypothetical protein
MRRVLFSSSRAFLLHSFRILGPEPEGAHF